MKILFTLILWHFWIPFDKTGYKQNAESIRTSINIVICSKIILKFDEVPTTDFLPIAQHHQKCIYIEDILTQPQGESKEAG